MLTAPVKLVVWDLDDTLWAGTLSEGDVALVDELAELIRTLNRRGIVSSVCSKNDAEAARRQLADLGLWDELVFASIDWSPKGARVASLVEEMQLRPENVLFVDDHPLNREEVRAAVPGIQVIDPADLLPLVADPALEGKDDRGLTRLDQYRLLERKARDRTATAVSHEQFLRSCDIRVRLLEPTEDDLPRLAELVERTNQLNFTKRRLGREDLARLVTDPDRRSGYVTVRDRYGDYGICGFFSLSPDGSVLEDFLFSCRVLHMGVESWLYRHLGSPALAVVGEVAGSVDEDVDWIALDEGTRHEVAAPPAVGSTGGRSRVLMMGGCDLAAIAQYLGGSIETDLSRATPGGALVHVEHSDLLRQAAEGVTEDQLALADRLPFLDRGVFDPLVFNSSFDVFVYSVLMDYTQGRYRHRSTGLVVPWHQHDQVVTDPDNWERIVDRFGHAGVDVPFLEWFAGEFEALGPLPPEAFRDQMAWLVGALPAGTRILFLNGAEVPVDNPLEPDRHERHRVMNDALDEVVRELPAAVVDVRTVVTSDEDLHGDLRHYRRHVYLALAEAIRAAVPDGLRPKRPSRTAGAIRRLRQAAGTRRQQLVAAGRGRRRSAGSAPSRPEPPRAETTRPA